MPVYRYRTIPVVHVPLDSLVAHPVDPLPSPEHQVLTLENRTRILQIFTSMLRPRDALVLRLLYFEDCSTRDVARQLALSVKTVESIRTAAFKVLRSHPELVNLLRSGISK